MSRFYRDNTETISRPYAQYVDYHFVHSTRVFLTQCQINYGSDISPRDAIWVMSDVIHGALSSAIHALSMHYPRTILPLFTQYPHTIYAQSSRYLRSIHAVQA